MASVRVGTSALILVLLTLVTLRSEVRTAPLPESLQPSGESSGTPTPPPLPPEIEALRSLEAAPGDPRGMLLLPFEMRHPRLQELDAPMEPPPAPRSGGSDEEGRVLTLDRRTGKVTEESFERVAQLLDSRYTQGGVGIRELLEEPEEIAKNFSMWTEVDDPTVGQYPRRVKLIIDFRDVNGNLVEGVQCSGTLIDPMHVITAAHCVWSHTLSSGAVINNWAENIEVAPGYEDGNEPFGFANFSQLHVWGNWVDDWDYDHDLGIIDLDRPVGFLSGWHGYGYDENCSFWESSTWRHEGYPAEQAYGFNGERLYENSGDFDDCVQDGWDNRASWNGPSYGGSSGSGGLKTSTGAVYGVFSTSDRATVSVDCKLTSVKFGDIGQMIVADKPASLDLVALRMRGPTQVVSGYRPDFLDFVVGDYSQASGNGTWNYSVYLSTNATITPSDTYLGSGSFSQSFTPNTATWVDMSVTPTIPAGTPSGSYFIGIILTTVDANSANNATSGQDAWPITVICPEAGAPDQLTPLSGTNCAEFSQYFSWSAVAPLADYQLQLGTSCGSGPIIDTTSLYYTWENLQPNTTYYWRVRGASQCGGWGPWSSCRYFTTKADIYDVSSVVSPADGAQCQGGSVLLQWAALPQAASYDVQLSPTWCYEGTITSGIPSTFLTVNGLSPNTTYYWRVRAQTVCGQTTDWSSVPGFCWTFKTAPDSIAPPLRIGPADGTSCGSASTYLAWNHAEDWDHYEVQVGTSPGTGPVYTTTSNGYNPPGLVSEVVYYWRVRTFHQCGLSSDWTDSWSFSLDLEPPTNPTSVNSNSHTVATWSTDNTIDVYWDWGNDNCSGSFPQYATLWDQSPTTEPTVPTTSGELTLETSPPLEDGQNHWFHLRTVDWAGNPATETLHLGPFWIDATPPTDPQFDYRTMDPGLITGPTTLVVDWLESSDETSGLAGYSWAAGTTSTPPPALDNIADVTVPWVAAPMQNQGAFWFFVQAADVAGNVSNPLVIGPYTVDPQRFGIYITSPWRGDLLTEGSLHQIQWSLHNPSSRLLQSGQLDLSLDKGNTWQLLANLQPDQILLEHYDWTVPAASSQEAVVRLTVMDVGGSMVYDRSVRHVLEQGTTTPDIPPSGGFALAPAHPNPFNPQTTIAFDLPRAARVTLRIHDSRGRFVRTLVDDWKDGPARHEVVWDGRDENGLSVVSGVYRYTLEAEGFRRSRSMVLVK